MDPVPSAGPAGSPSDETLQALAGRGRALVIESVAGAGAGHIGGPLSAMETATPGPVYLRLGREAGPDVFDASYRFEPGRVVRLRDGADVLLVSTGMQTARTLAAAELLAAVGIEAGLIHVPCLKPVDAEAIATAAAAVPLLVTTEEHTVLGGLGGLGGLIAEIVSRTMPRRVEAIGIDDEWGESAPNDRLLDRSGLTPERIAERVRDAIARAGTARA